jgi:hypothetical protein
MKIGLQRLLFLTLTGASFLVSFGFVSNAAAGADCRQPNSGYLCFYDIATKNYGRVAGDNPVWANLPGGWDNRADRFWNYGRTHGVCLFRDTHYRHLLVGIGRGIGIEGGNLSNSVSSNDWVRDLGDCHR